MKFLKEFELSELGGPQKGSSELTPYSHGTSTVAIHFEWMTLGVAEMHCGSVGGTSVALLTAEVGTPLFKRQHKRQPIR